MKLSPRQWQIAELIADDEDVEAISESLGISAETVRRHLADIRRKKNLTSTVQIANWVWKKRFARKPTYNDVAARP